MAAVAVSFLVQIEGLENRDNNAIGARMQEMRRRFNDPRPLNEENAVAVQIPQTPQDNVHASRFRLYSAMSNYNKMDKFAHCENLYSSRDVETSVRYRVPYDRQIKKSIRRPETRSDVCIDTSVGKRKIS